VTAGFDRPEDQCRVGGAEAYLAFAAGEKRSCCIEASGSFRIVAGRSEVAPSPVAPGIGARFHVTWGTGPASSRPSSAAFAKPRPAGLVTSSSASRRRPDGERRVGRFWRPRAILEPSSVDRAAEFASAGWRIELRAQSGDRDLGGLAEITSWSARTGLDRRPAAQMPQRRAGSCRWPHLAITHRAAGRSSTAIACGTTWKDPRTEPDLAGPRDPDPTRAVVHVVRRARKSSARPLFPGFDTLGTLEHLGRTGFDYSWFVLTQRIIKREFAPFGPSRIPT